MTALDLLTSSFLWVINGFLYLVYLMAERIVILLLLPALYLFLFTRHTPDAQRPWAAAAGSLVIAASVLAPSPAGVMLLAMLVAAIISVNVEQMDPIDLRWRNMGGLALYSLISLGFWFYLTYLQAAPYGSSIRGAAAQTLAQGGSYLAVIGAFAMYVVPLGYLALIAQRIWVHAPLGRGPADMIHTIRGRGLEEKR